MNKVLIICGSTATGKTELGIKLARMFGGEIVSADSRQVYRGMDVGTGKDLLVSSKFKVQSAKLQFSVQSFRIGYYDINGVKVWLLDIVEPDYKFNVADYKKCADLVIKDIWQRGKLPIMVGGTGFYIKAVVDGIETIGVEPDWKLREKLSNCQTGELQIMLKGIDPEHYRRMNESDKQNPRRLIRAIEIAKDVKGQSASRRTNTKAQCQNLNVNKLFVGLMAPNSILYQGIDQRVDERVKQGIEEEIRGLLEKAYDWKNSALGVTLAYREWQKYFEGKITKEETIRKWKFDEHDYGRRQMTWFKKDQRINWFDISKRNYAQKVEKLVKSWYIGDDA